MFKVIPRTSDRVDIEISGKLDKEQMKTALDELIEKCSDIENGKMLYRISGFELPTFGALAVELSRLPQLFKLIHKFDRAAVLAEKEWMRKASEIEGKLFPGLEIKAFGLEAEAEAEAWLAN